MTKKSNPISKAAVFLMIFSICTTLLIKASVLIGLFATARIMRMI